MFLSMDGCLRTEFLERKPDCDSKTLSDSRCEVIVYNSCLGLAIFCKIEVEGFLEKIESFYSIGLGYHSNWSVRG